MNYKNILLVYLKKGPNSISPLCPFHLALPLLFAHSCFRVERPILVEIGLNGPRNKDFPGEHFKRKAMRYFPACEYGYGDQM